MCFVSIWEQTATCATYSINWLVFINQMKSVYSAVRTGSLNKAVWASSLKRWILVHRKKFRGTARPQKNSGPIAVQIPTTRSTVILKHLVVPQVLWKPKVNYRINNSPQFVPFLNHVHPWNAVLNPICQLMALLGAHHIFHVSVLRVNPTDATPSSVISISTKLSSTFTSSITVKGKGHPRTRYEGPDGE